MLVENVGKDDFCKKKGKKGIIRVSDRPDSVVMIKKCVLRKSRFLIEFALVPKRKFIVDLREKSPMMMVLRLVLCPTLALPI